MGSKQRRGTHTCEMVSRKEDAIFVKKRENLLKFELKLKTDKEKENFEAAVVKSFAKNEHDVLMVTLEGEENFDCVMNSDCSFHSS